MTSVVTFWVQTQSVLTTTKAAFGVGGVQLLLESPQAANKPSAIIDVAVMRHDDDPSTVIG